MGREQTLNGEMMEEIRVKIPSGVDVEKIRKFLELDAEILARAMKKHVQPGMLGKASLEELEEFAWEAGR